jgi:adenosylcobinamide-GDP ribazoletransferase
VMLPPPIRGARAAFVFLTRIPLGGFPYRDADWQWASAHFPFVGAALGLFSGGLYWLVSGAGPLAAAAVVVAISMLVTGAFHEDGLADTADALGGAFDRAKLFAILKDSRIGSFGGAALTIVLVLRVALLARLDTLAPAALVLTQALSRTGPVGLMVTMPYVTADEASKSRLLTRATFAQGLCALGWSALVAWGVTAFGLRGTEVAAAAGAGAAATVVCGARFHARAGGITGDFLGATQQVSECAMLLALALAHGGPR